MLKYGSVSVRHERRTWVIAVSQSCWSLTAVLYYVRQSTHSKYRYVSVQNNVFHYNHYLSAVKYLSMTGFCHTIILQRSCESILSSSACCFFHSSLNKQPHIKHSPNCCPQLKSRSSPARSAGTSPQGSTMESSPAKAARWGSKYKRGRTLATKFNVQSSFLPCLMLWCVHSPGAGLLPPQSAEQRHVLVFPPEELPDRPDQPQPLPALPLAKVSCSGHEQRW